MQPIPHLTIYRNMGFTCLVRTNMYLSEELHTWNGTMLAFIGSTSISNPKAQGPVNVLQQEKRSIHTQKKWLQVVAFWYSTHVPHPRKQSKNKPGTYFFLCSLRFGPTTCHRFPVHKMSFKSYPDH